MSHPFRPTWQATDPGRARALADARLQLHYAAQFATALGISYLRPEADDGHTNLGWDAAIGALVSCAVPGTDGAVMVGVRARDLGVFLARAGVVVDEITLAGMTIDAAQKAIRAALGRAGLDGSRYHLGRHYDLPPHAVAAGERFDAGDTAAFDELGRWFGDAAITLGHVARDVPGASEVRIWPHHFDIATLVAYPGGASTGAGLEPGDGSYDEPYYYVNMRPQPSADRLTAPLAGGGRWHTRGWSGAVLLGSDLAGSAAEQERQVRAFLDSALEACRALVDA